MAATGIAMRPLILVALPPGRFMLVTRPIFTGSAPTANTMGMDEVAAFAASAAAVALPVAITATRRALGGALGAGSHFS
jgi:hypothetical protein